MAQWLSEKLSSEQEECAHRVAKEWQLPFWVSQILVQRARSWPDSSISAMEKFLQPSLQHLPNPFALKDMEKAVGRVIQALQKDEKVLIYGDYDVDGTVGAAILRRFFRSLNKEPFVFQPDRKKEGYGLNTGALEAFSEKGVKLVISVDCGISNVVEAKRARELGMDLIICDHHEVPDPVPEAVAILDHKRTDDHSGIEHLCGAGMAFYLIMAVRSALREQGAFQSAKEPDLRNLLDLVAVATIADMVPLLEENRVLVHVGLSKLRTQPCAGLKALCEVAGVEFPKVGTYHVGFVLGPRINASGRLGSASMALELLSTDSLEKARSLASELQSINRERMEVQKKITFEAVQESKRLLEDFAFPALVVGSKDWHEGVIGIVASRLVEKFYRPAIVVSFKSDPELGKGSVRSYRNIDVLACLTECEKYLETFGGHQAAAGLSVTKEKFPLFQQAFACAVGKQVERLTKPGQTLLDRNIRVDIDLSQDALDMPSIQSLERLAPFGMGNPAPVVALKGMKVKNSRLLKEEHLKLSMEMGEGELEALWFYAPKGKDIVAGDCIDLVGNLQISTFRGHSNLELRVKDLC